MSKTLQFFWNITDHSHVIQATAGPGLLKDRQSAQTINWVCLWYVLMLQTTLGKVTFH